MIFRSLDLWIDSVFRGAPETLAADEWLLETITVPVLRVYRWPGGWGSIGYFGKLDEARRNFPMLSWVRRWTGGGIVDHRADWTYTLAIPAGAPLAAARGAESYRLIHGALAAALAAEGFSITSSAGISDGGAVCFEAPAEYDLLSADGKKIAGAGQRRTTRGLVHQGSVALAADAGISATRAARFAEALAENVRRVVPEPSPDVLAQRSAARYGNLTWLERR